MKEIQAGYLNSPPFRGIYLYPAQNRLALSNSEIRRTGTLVERYILLDSLLFRLNTSPGGQSVILAIPEHCIDRMITLYHCSIFAGHQGIIEMYLTINEKFFPDRIHYLRAYMKECPICQLHRKEKPHPGNCNIG